MRLPEYSNLSTGQVLRGVLKNSGDAHRPHTLYVKALEAQSSLGDVIVCTGTGEVHVVTFQNLSDLNPGLRPNKRHYSAHLMEIHGKATIQRRSTATDDFGRLRDSLDTIVSDVQTTLPDSRLIVLPLSPAGGHETILEYTLLILASEEIRPGDVLIYTGHGPRPSEFRVIDSSYIAPNLQEITCRR